MYLCKILENYGFPPNYSVTSKSDVFDFFLNLSTDSSGFLKKEKVFQNIFLNYMKNINLFVSQKKQMIGIFVKNCGIFFKMIMNLN